jgi:hypothetical protein
VDQALDLHTAFLEFSRQKLIEQYWPRLRTCVERLSDEQVWWRPNDVSNSIGNLILHLNGNVQQWLVSSFKRSDDIRDRPAEFRERRLLPASALLEKLDTTLKEAAEVLSSLSEADLLTHLKFKAIPSPVYTRSTKWLNILDYIMDRLSTSPK